MPSLPSLAELVASLPEVYQPIYGHAEFNAQAQRNVEDRLLSIRAVHDALAHYLKRPLRVLDLGCAQGWFSFSLAKAGAQVVGLDIIAANINVCNMLALEHRDLNARFKLFEVEKVPERIPAGQFDLMLGLSVVHHLCFHNGKEATRDFMQTIFAKIPHGIFEFALASEPTNLASAQPENPEYLIDQIPFYRLLSRHTTPLAPGKRPLYFCSHNVWYLDGAMCEFDRWEQRENNQRVFYGHDKVVQFYPTYSEQGEINRHAAQEAAQKEKPSRTGNDEYATWLVYEKS